MQLVSTFANWFDRSENEDDLFHRTWLADCKVMIEKDKENPVINIVSSIIGISGVKKDEMINFQLSHFLHGDSQFGMVVAKGLGITIDQKKMNHLKKYQNTSIFKIMEKFTVNSISGKARSDYIEPEPNIHHHVTHAGEGRPTVIIHGWPLSETNV